MWLACVACGAGGCSSVTSGGQGPFEDVTGGVHAPAIEALAYAGIIAGTECSNDNFCPHEPFERWTMAVWMVRALGEQPSTTPVQYRDVSNDSWWAPYVQRLYELGITKGCTDTRYCPHDTVTRAQMATFLVRTFDPDPAGGVAYFTDVHELNFHGNDIIALAESRITAGCDSNRYCPSQPTTRAQMASFTARATGLISLPRQPFITLPGKGITITAGRPDWASGHFQVQVYKQLLEELGYSVTDPADMELSAGDGFIAMAQGKLDFWTNSWYPVHYGWHDQRLPDESLIGDHLTIVGEEMVLGGLQGLLITKSFADEFGVYTLDDLNNNEAALAAYDETDSTPGNGTAEIFGCHEGWVCGDIIESQIESSGWDNIVQVRGAYEPQFDRALNHILGNLPIVIYAYAPSQYFGRMPLDNVYWLGVEEVIDHAKLYYSPSASHHLPRGNEEHMGFSPVSVDQCPSAANEPSGLCKVGWQIFDILVTANSQFLAKNPAARALFEVVKLSPVEVSEAIAAHSKESSPARLASDWIIDNRAKVNRWLAAVLANS